MEWLARVLYNLLLPVASLLAAPGWLIRMARRGGLSRRLWERLTIYDRDVELEPSGVVYVHAVSVGEVLIALKLIARWSERASAPRFVLAATTSTGFDLATARAPDGVRVIYSAIDHACLINRLLDRFDPNLVVLIESELWPNLIRLARRRGIPVAVANARLSPGSEGRYRRLAALARPMMQSLSAVCVQAEPDAGTWRDLGVATEAVHVTGSIKFDLAATPAPRARENFAAMLEAAGPGRAVVVALSTHPGEELLIARAVAKCDGALAVIAPRHAERREEVRAELEQAGFEVVLRSSFASPGDASRSVFVIDSTGELRDWTAHATVVVVGKSFTATGGQNPTEAIMAGVPVVTGRHMDNFEPLISELRQAGAVVSVSGEKELTEAIAGLLGGTTDREMMTASALTALDRHRGATDRTIDRLESLLS